jgi:hypothetical protein
MEQSCHCNLLRRVLGIDMNRYNFSRDEITPRNPKMYVLKAFIERYEYYSKNGGVYNFTQKEAHQYPEIIDIITQHMLKHKGQFERLHDCTTLYNVYLKFQEDHMFCTMATVCGMAFTIGPGGYYDPFTIPYDAFL